MRRFSHAGRRQPFARSSIVAVELAAAGEMTGWLSTVIIELSQDSTGRLSEVSIVDVARAVTVSFCGLCDGHQSPHSHGTRVTAMTECDLAKQHQRTQRAFGHVVGGRHASVVQKHEPFMLMPQNSLLQSHSLFVSHRKSDQLLQAFSQPDLLCCLLSFSEFTVLAKAMKFTSVSHELANGREEAEVSRVGSRQLLPISCCPSQMEQAFLFRTSRIAGILLRHVGGEFVLPLQLQFQLDLVQFLLQPLVFLEQPITASSPQFLAFHKSLLEDRDCNSARTTG